MPLKVTCFTLQHLCIVYSNKHKFQGLTENHLPAGKQRNNYSVALKIDSAIFSGNSCKAILLNELSSVKIDLKKNYIFITQMRPKRVKHTMEKESE